MGHGVNGSCHVVPNFLLGLVQHELTRAVRGRSEEPGKSMPILLTGPTVPLALPK